MTVLRSVELSAELISDVVNRIKQAGIEFTYDTGETTVVPMTVRWPTISPGACATTSPPIRSRVDDLHSRAFLRRPRIVAVEPACEVAVRTATRPVPGCSGRSRLR